MNWYWSVVLVLILGFASPFLIIKKIVAGVSSQTQIGWPSIFMEKADSGSWVFTSSAYIKDALIFSGFFLVLFLIIFAIRSQSAKNAKNQ